MGCCASVLQINRNYRCNTMPCWSQWEFSVSFKPLNFDFLMFRENVLKDLSLVFVFFLFFLVESSQAGSQVNAADISEATLGCVHEPNGTTS